MSLSQLFMQHGIALTDSQERKFARYKELLLEYNEKFNLTAITDSVEIDVKHFLDSALAYKYIAGKTVDIGSGAGFPAIPLKIILPETEFTLLDALQKRVGFLTAVTDELGLSGVTCLHQRAEEHALICRETYDTAVVRAVAGLATLAEYALPLLKTGGCLIAYKGEEPEREKEESAAALKILGGRVKSIEKFLLPDQSKRSFIIVEKTAATPAKFPRGGNRPKKNPL